MIFSKRLRRIIAVNSFFLQFVCPLSSMAQQSRPLDDEFFIGLVKSGEGPSMSALGLFRPTESETRAKLEREKINFQADSTAAAYENLNKEILDFKATQNYRLGVANAAGFLVEAGLITGATLATAGTATPLAIAGLAAGGTFVVGKGLEAGLNQLEEHYAKSSSDFIGHFYLKLGKDQFSAALDEISKLTPAEAKQKAKELVGKVSEDIDLKFEGVDKSVAKQAFTESIAKQLVENYASLNSRTSNLEKFEREAAQKFGSLESAASRSSEQISLLSQQVSAVQMTLIKFNAQSQKNFEILNETTQIIKKDLDLVNSRLDRVEAKSDFLVLSTYKNLSPQEKIAALKDPNVFPELGSKQREEAIANLQKLKTLTDIQNTANDILNATGSLAQIAKGLGVDPRVVSTVNQVARVAGALVGIGTSIASGNILGVLSGVASLFTGPDPAEARHKEVMDTLGKILEGQAALYANQKIMLENQRKLLAGQRAILYSIQEVSQKIDKRFDEAQQQLKIILGEVYYNRKLLNDIFNESLMSCRDLQNAFKHYHPSGNAEVEGSNLFRFDSINDLNSFLALYSKKLETCITSLSDVYFAIASKPTDHLNRFQSSLYVRNFDNENERFHFFLENSFIPILNLHRNFRKAPMASTMFEQFGLTNPSLRFRDLEEKWDLNTFKDRHGDIQPSVLISHLDSYLPYKVHTPRLIALVSFLLKTLPLYEFSQMGFGVKNSETSPKSLRGQERKVIKVMLEAALKNVQLAIAQENLLSGETLFEGLHTLLSGATEPNNEDCDSSTLDRDYPKNIVCVLVHSPYLAKNFTNFAVRKSLKFNRYSLLFYGSLLASRDDYSVNKVFSVLPHSTWVLKGTQQAIGEVKLQIGKVQTQLTVGSESPLEALNQLRGSSANDAPEAQKIYEKLSLYLGHLKKLGNDLDKEPNEKIIAQGLVRVFELGSQIRNPDPHDSQGIGKVLRDIKVIQNPFEFKLREDYPVLANRKSSRWFLKLGNYEFLLPSLTEVATGRIFHTPELKELLALREQIQSYLEGFLLQEKLSPQERGIIGTQLLVNSVR